MSRQGWDFSIGLSLMLLVMGGCVPVSQWTDTDRAAMAQPRHVPPSDRVGFAPTPGKNGLIIGGPRDGAIISNGTTYYPDGRVEFERRQDGIIVGGPPDGALKHGGTTYYPDGSVEFERRH
ncbi:MAG: hypothetical protein HY348_06060 [Nitrospira defluvii]|nr:hypothetical protein [Nitrospira defluvii]